MLLESNNFGQIQNPTDLQTRGIWTYSLLLNALTNKNVKKLFLRLWLKQMALLDCDSMLV